MTDTSMVVPNSERSRSQVVREAALVAAAMLLVRLIHLDHTVHLDELFHVLAAHSLLTDGTLRIADGEPYVRGWVFTHLMAGFFRLFGESLVVARLPAVLAGAAVAVALFLWTRAVAGRTAAWTAVVFFGLSPAAIYLSQVARFYTLQALLFWLGAISVYGLVSGSLSARQRVALIVSGATALVLAVHLQLATVIGIAAIALWAAATTYSAVLRRVRTIDQRFLLAMAAAALILLTIALLSGVLASVLERAFWLFRYADAWAAGDRSNLRYYHSLLLELYPSVYSLFPIAVLLALVSYPRPASFCLCLFGVSFIAHSLAAWKTERYMFYAMPAFFALAGMGTAQAVSWIGPKLAAALSQRLGSHLPRRWFVSMKGSLVATVGLFLLASNQGFVYSFKMLTLSDADWRYDRRYRGEPDWASAAERLRPLADSSAVVVSLPRLKALYYLGRGDVGLHWFHSSSSPGGQLTSGTPQSDGAASPARVNWKVKALERLIACNRSGLIVFDAHLWRADWGVDRTTARYILEHTRRVPLDERWRVMAFEWLRQGGVRSEPDCKGHWGVSQVLAQLRSPVVAAHAPRSAAPVR